MNIEGDEQVWGIYVNPGNIAFQRACFSDIYIDKSMLISKLNAAYGTKKRFLCVSRPRRFGKSMAANMLTAYYSCGCDSAELFAGLKIEKEYASWIEGYTGEILLVGINYDKEKRIMSA